MHISYEEIKRFQEQSMNKKDMIAFLEHIDNCNYCLEQMIEWEETSCTSKAPAYLKEQILSQAAAPSTQAKKAGNEISYRLQLFYCGLKTAAGVLAALFLLFHAGNIDLGGLTSSLAIHNESADTRYLPPNNPDYLQEPNYLYQFSQIINQEITKKSETITRSLDDFSKKITNGGR